MKTLLKFFTVILVTVFIQSCEKNQDTQSEIKGKLLDFSECKSGDSLAKKNENTPDNLSCIEYSYDGSTGTLLLKHINAGFNCCPGELSADISLKGDTIVVEEIESEHLCKCNCLYDLDFELNGVNKKDYIIKIVEPYRRDQAELVFGVDLNSESSGEYCVTRNAYPWGVYSNNYIEISGELINNSTCKKSVESSSETVSITNNESCVEYSYNGENSILTLKHVNTVFNCCPGELSADISMKGDTIVVAEFESYPQCLCTCLYDLDIEISGVQRREYVLKFVEPYKGDQAELVFEVDLNSEPSGEYCVTGNDYP